MCWRGTTARRGISLGDITVHLSIGQRRGNDSSHGITVFSLTLCPAPTFMSGLFFVNHHCLPAVWLLLCWVDKSLSVNYHNLAPPQSLHPDLSMVIRWHLVWACKAVGFIPLVIVREGECFLQLMNCNVMLSVRMCSDVWTHCILHLILTSRWKCSKILFSLPIPSNYP